MSDLSVSELKNIIKDYKKKMCPPISKLNKTGLLKVINDLNIPIDGTKKAAKPAAPAAKPAAKPAASPEQQRNDLKQPIRKLLKKFDDYPTIIIQFIKKKSGALLDLTEKEKKEAEEKSKKNPSPLTIKIQEFEKDDVLKQNPKNIKFDDLKKMNPEAYKELNNLLVKSKDFTNGYVLKIGLDRGGVSGLLSSLDEENEEEEKKLKQQIEKIFKKLPKKYRVQIGKLEKNKLPSFLEDSPDKNTRLVALKNKPLDLSIRLYKPSKNQNEVSKPTPINMNDIKKMNPDVYKQINNLLEKNKKYKGRTLSIKIFEGGASDLVEF